MHLLGAKVFGWIIICSLFVLITVIMSTVTGMDLVKYLKENNYDSDLQKLSYGKLTKDPFQAYSYLSDDAHFHDDEKLLALKNNAKKWHRYLCIAFLITGCSILAVVAVGFLYSFIRGT